MSFDRKAYMRERYRTNPEYQRGLNYTSKYGISIEDYNGLFEKQDGRCKVCRIHQSELSRRLCVDHDHKTGEVRGLLCNKCNTNIAELEKFSLRQLRDMMLYLEAKE